MIELAFIACLTASPATCREEVLLYADIPIMVCLVRGQSELAAWTTLYPKWGIKSWSCRPHDPTIATL